MALLDEVKSELSNIDGGSPAVQKAQVTSMLYFGRGFRKVQRESSTQIIVQPQFDSMEAAMTDYVPNSSSWEPVCSKKATLPLQDQMTGPSPAFATWHSFRPCHFPASVCILCLCLSTAMDAGEFSITSSMTSLSLEGPTVVSVPSS